MISKKSILIILISTVIVLLVFDITIHINTNKKISLPQNGCVQTEEDAIEIGKTICKTVYSYIDHEKIDYENNDQYLWETLYNDKEDIWIVFYGHRNGVIGGLPEVHIKRKNAEVVFISLMA